MRENPIPEIITQTDAQYAFDIVETICTEIGPGLPGSPQERERAAVFKKELESHLGAENVVAEEFTLAPGAFLSIVPGLFLLLAVLLNISLRSITGVLAWAAGVAALVFSILPPLVFILQFLLGLEVIDPLLKKKQSVNVIGTLRKPGTKVKRLLILSGHHDSAPANTWLSLSGYVNQWLIQRSRRAAAQENARLRFFAVLFFIFSTTFFIGFFTMLVMSILQLAGLIAGDAHMVRIGTLGWAMLAYPILPAVIYGFFTIRGTKGAGIVPGAVDNLSASALSVAMCRFLVNNPAAIPEDTEIRFISFGSEEAGLRGSRRYVERHLDELKRLDVRLLNFEMVAHPEIIITATEVTGTVKNSPEMMRSLVAAAQRAGVPYRVQAGPGIGVGTDAASFSRIGLKAATLLPFKMPEQQMAFYHQSRDKPDVMTIEPLFNVLKLSLEWLRSGGE